jgi:hypothetical protein
MFSFVVCNASSENENKGQQLSYNKITCERIKYQIEILYF